MHTRTHAAVSPPPDARPRATTAPGPACSCPQDRRSALTTVTPAPRVVQLELGNPLQLSTPMRERLMKAVRALADAPALSEASDAVRLGAVVLMAKARARREYRTSIWAEELGRWLGVSQSTVAHSVLPHLRNAGILETEVVTDAYGHPTGLDCQIIPLRQAHDSGDRRHPLALSRVELAVLLRLCETLFGPGWSPKDGTPIPAGLLAARTGRGAATDRLGLLLMVLSTGSTGWLQLCPGTVASDRGRPAATVARLLGCTPSGGAKVLARLQDQGLVEVTRRESASGLNHRSRVRLVPVAQAHGRTAAHREDRTASRTVLSDLPATAQGDLDTRTRAQTLALPADMEATGREMACPADLAGSAQHHAHHTPVVTEVGHGEGDSGFSGHGRLSSRGLPDRAHAREDAAGADAQGHLALIVGGRGPLRGDKPFKSPVDEGASDRQPTASPARRPVSQQRGRTPRPPAELLAVLAPAELLWARLDRPYARRLVESAARTELTAVAGIVGRADAGDLLAARLTRRLAADGGPAAVTDPVGWLIARGLPRRPGCADARCDEGLRLDTGSACTTCEYLLADRRAQRQRIADALEAEMPRTGEAERKTAVERRLHEEITAQGWAKARRRQQLEAEHAARRAAAAQARADAELETVPTTPAAPFPAAAAPVLTPVTTPGTEEESADDAGRAPLVLEELTREQVIDLRMRATHDHQLVLDHIREHGEFSARRLYTHRFVDQIQRLSGAGHLVLHHTTWEQT
ncbi:hypothetical protein [Streptomyces luteireticuli]|uniref:hypothetical protein n=1 Tax=Streptomyces luteireticuli TaxID=173858 RepID=UPI003558DA71